MIHVNFNILRYILSYFVIFSTIVVNLITSKTYLCDCLADCSIYLSLDRILLSCTRLRKSASSKSPIKGSASTKSAISESGGRNKTNTNDAKYTHGLILLSIFRSSNLRRISISSMIGNWNPNPMRADVRNTVVSKLLTSKIFPMPSEEDRFRKISICHFIMINPKIKPTKNKTSDRGKLCSIALNSPRINAGRRNITIS